MALLHITNARRTLWAEAALLTFGEETHLVLAQEPEDTLADLLADLRHWADAHGIDYENEDRRGAANYAEEVEEEGGRRREPRP